MTNDTLITIKNDQLSSYNNKSYILIIPYDSNIIPGDPFGLPDVFIMKDTLIFIDSGYLSFISKHFGKGKPIKYKIEKFAENLTKSKNLNCKKIYFYTAPPYQSQNPTNEENKRKAKYDKFISKLKKVGIIVKEGRCQKIDSIYQQKGVDTLMTMDLSRIPKKEGIENVIVITSDTDFVPIIKDLQEDGTNVILAYFTDKKRKSAFSLSNHLWKACKSKIPIKKEHFLKNRQDIAIVYMVAGLSSRFGGRVKQLVKVTDEHTLIEYSLEQAIKAGFNKIIFIVGEKTEQHFKEMFGNSYKGIPIQYVFQTYNKEKRDRPWGTAATVVEIKDINCPFVICNGDDIYGENSFKILADHLKQSQENATIGYKLEDVMPEQGSVNRAIFEIDEEGYGKNLAENLNIEKNSLPNHLTLNDLCSMNIFAFHPETTNHFHEKFIIFQEQNKEDRRIEFLLPNIIGELVKENKIKMKVYPTSDKWIGITNPGDEEILREMLKRQNKEISDNI